MTHPAAKLPPFESPRPRLGRNDPILQELWAVKAAMNAEAGYSIAKLAEQARNFDLDLSDDMATRLDVEFYQDAKDALLKALVD